MGTFTFTGTFTLILKRPKVSVFLRVGKCSGSIAYVRPTWTGKESHRYKTLPPGKLREKVRDYPLPSSTTSVPPSPWWLGLAFPEDD